MYSTIVVGVNKSQTARRATEHAVALGRALDANVHLVYAYPKDQGPVDGRDTPGRIDAERAMEQVMPHVDPQKYTAHALPGAPVRAIIQVASEVGADLIVVGNKRMQGTSRILGSVPNDIAHHAPCAVLIVKTT
jgi:nucleotide-binding universal stress UspA family protein